MMKKFLLGDNNESNRNLSVKRKIINYFLVNDNGTIGELNKDMGLSIPTITKFIDELIEKHFILELGKKNTNGGRRPSEYGLNPSAGFFIGVDIYKTYINIGIVNFRGNIIRIDDRIPFNMDNTKQSLEVLCKLIEQFIKETAIPRDQVLAVGVNICGRVDPFNGVSYAYYHFEKQTLANLMKVQLHLDVYLDNISRAMVYAEYLQGVINGEKNILFIDASMDLGLGIIINGELYYGNSGYAGDLGHCNIYDNEILCKCGKTGCLETEISGLAFVRILKERFSKGNNTSLSNKIVKNEPILLQDILEAISRGDVLVMDIIEKMGLKLGRFISILNVIFNPDRIIIGGGFSLTGDVLLLPVRSALNKYSQYVNKDTNFINISELGEHASVIGACLLARSKMINNI